MDNSLFLHSDVTDPYAIYDRRLSESSVFFDASNKIFAVYSYRHCKALLMDPGMLIPAIAETGLSPRVLAIRRQLARLSNPPHHAINRQTAMLLFEQLRPVDIATILEVFLPPPRHAMTLDWAEIAGVLPAVWLLKSFGFNDVDCGFIVRHLSVLCRIMQPASAGGHTVETDEIIVGIYERVEAHLARTLLVPSAELTGTKLPGTDLPGVAGTELPGTDLAGVNLAGVVRAEAYVSNLIGFLIQGYDAGRGLLSNALLAYLRFGGAGGGQKITGEGEGFANKGEAFFIDFVTEVCRFYSPVHNTRRFADKDIVLDGRHTIKKGECILLVLAAANRDPQQFSAAEQFDMGRKNNRELLSFGFGAHACIGAMLSTRLAAKTLEYLAGTYDKIDCIEKEIRYAPLVNVRVPRRLFVRFS